MSNLGELGKEHLDEILSFVNDAVVRVRAFEPIPGEEDADRAWYFKHKVKSELSDSCVDICSHVEAFKELVLWLGVEGGAKIMREDNPTLCYISSIEGIPDSACALLLELHKRGNDMLAAWKAKDAPPPPLKRARTEAPSAPPLADGEPATREKLWSQKEIESVVLSVSADAQAAIAIDMSVVAAQMDKNPHLQRSFKETSTSKAEAVRATETKLRQAINDLHTALLLRECAERL